MVVTATSRCATLRQRAALTTVGALLLPLTTLAVAARARAELPPPLSDTFSDLGRRCGEGQRKACDKLPGTALQKPDGIVAAAAAWWLREEADLDVVARTARTPAARSVAVAKIADPLILAEVVRHDPEQVVRASAARRITSQQPTVAVGSVGSLISAGQWARRHHRDLLAFR